jgi:hypothetical protein
MDHREYQRDILRQLSDLYPAHADVSRLLKTDEKGLLTKTLFYLREHGLVRFDATSLMSGEYMIGAVQITAKGVDFISDDGGLSSILGVVTIKLHQDTIKDLLIQKVLESEGDETVKGQLVEKVKSLPSAVLEQLSQVAVQKGIEAVPNIITWLGTILVS